MTNSEIEDAVASNRAYNHATDFPTLIDEIFDASVDFLTYRAAYALMLVARYKDRDSLYSSDRSMRNSLNRVVDLLQKAGFANSVIAEFTTSLGATQDGDSSFAIGVMDTIEYAASVLVNETVRKLGEASIEKERHEN